MDANRRSAEPTQAWGSLTYHRDNERVPRNPNNPPHNGRMRMHRR